MVFLLLLVVLSVAGATPIDAAPGPPYRNRPLVQVLQELKDGGLALIYSSALVKPRLRVQAEPAATEPRALLEEILAPLGLEARDGPAGTILIVAGDPVFGPIRGRVRSAVRGVPVEEAVVRIASLGMTVVSGRNGEFEMEGVPAGAHDLFTEALGFQPATLAGVSLTSSEGTTVIIWLRDQPGFVTELVVTPSQHSVMDQELGERRTIRGQDTVLIPSFGGDISRVVEYLPGVTAPDNSAAFHVRGSLPGNSSFILDGLELYDPFHLQSFQSPFSLIDSKIVDRVDFAAGGFTADFGDRHGGRLEIRTLLPDHPHQGEVELGTLNSRFAYRAPLANGAGSWLVAARGWYPESFSDSIELGGGERVDPRFADIYAKGAFTVSPRAVISAHGLGVYDDLEFEEPPDEDGPGESAFALTRNGYVWVSATNAWTPAVTSESVLSYGFIQRRRNGLSEPDDDRFLVDDQRNVDFIGLRHLTSIQIGEANLIRVGLEGRELRATYRYRSELEGDPNTVERITLDSDGRSAAVFTSHRVRFGGRFTTEFGLRWDRQDYTNDNQVSPRFNAIWHAGERTELRLGMGKYTQSQRIHELRVEDGETAYNRAERSIQTEMAFQHRFLNGMRIRLDAYSRLLTRVNPRYENLWKPIELFPETGDDRIRIHPDRTRMKGTELMINGRPDRPFTWWLSYTWSTTEDTVNSSDILRSWDQPHAGKLLLAYKWGDRWMISLTGTAHTGWPTTPVSATSAPDPNGGLIITEMLEERNSDRYPTYIRLDAKARASFPLGGDRLSVTAEIINLTDRDNECCVDEFRFKPRPGGSVDVSRVFEHWRTITPTFSVLWEF